MPTQQIQYRRDTEQNALISLLHNLALDTGDFVLFDRPCLRMSLYGGTICACAKALGNTQWDHVGMIIRMPKQEDDLPSSSSISEVYLLEATLSGVKLRPLIERLERSNAQEIAIRRLQIHRTPEFYRNSLEFVNLVQGCKYEDRLKQFVHAGFQLRNRMKLESIFYERIDLQRIMRKYQAELDLRSNMTLFERNNIIKEMQAAQKRIHEIEHSLSRTHSENQKEKLEIPETIEYHHKVFCSQLLAAYYQHLGIILPYPSANVYAPQHFSSADTTKYLKLQLGATLLPEISVRQKLVMNAHEYQRRHEHGKQLKDLPNQDTDAIEMLIRALQRHSLFHNKTIDELKDLAGQFRRVELEAGQVVFHQGAIGDGFYIIERGECEVLVDYSYSSHDRLRSECLSETDKQLKQTPSKFSMLANYPSEHVLVGTNGPASAFGMSALIYDTPRRATVRVASPRTKKAIDSKPDETAILYKLEKNAFQQAIGQHNAFSIQDYVFLMKTISNHPLFQDLDDRTKALAVRKCFPLDYSAGDVILHQGDVGDYFYLIEDGECQVTRTKPSKQEQDEPRTSNGNGAPYVDQVLKKGDTFGEAALLYNSRRGASVTALQDTRVWCMDRASFVTITKSGSAYLHQIFKEASSVSRLQSKNSSDIRSNAIDHEYFMDRQDLERMLHLSASAIESPDESRKNRAIQLALALLLRDSSGVVNFSQFAHFHIALSSAQLDQLLPEAAFRALQNVSQEIDTGVLPTGGSHCNVKLKDLAKAMEIWRGLDPKESEPCILENLTFYKRIFELNLPDSSEAAMLSLGNHYVTFEDLVRGISSILHEQSNLKSLERYDPSKAEFLQFLETLQSDICDLRQIWNVAKVQKLDNPPSRSTGLIQVQFPTLLANCKFAALHCPTATNYEILKPNLESHEDEMKSFWTSGFDTLYILRVMSAIAAVSIARTVCAPLEHLKILMQVTPPKLKIPSSSGESLAYKSVMTGLCNMYKFGGIKNIFAGHLTHLMWLIPALPMKHFFCDAIRDSLSLLNSGNASEQSISRHSFHLDSTAKNSIAGGVAGILVNALCHPFDLIRSRQSVYAYQTNEKAYTFSQCVRETFAKDKVKGFFRGAIPSCLGAFIYFGTYYAMYEFWRPVFMLYHNDCEQNTFTKASGSPNNRGQILCAATAATVAQLSSYPFELIRRRMQVAGAWHPTLTFQRYDSAWQCFLRTMQCKPTRSIRYNPLKLYRGAGLNTLRVVPPVTIALWTYEALQRWGRMD